MIGGKIERTWTATALCVAKGLTTDQVVGLAHNLYGNARYDAISHVLNASFEVSASTREEAKALAELDFQRTELSQYVVSVTAREGARHSAKLDAGRKIDELTPELGGRWLVVTQGSSHMWDLDLETYVRIPGPHSKSGAFAFDRQSNKITRVGRWPRVGFTSLVWYDDPSNPHRSEHWRQSSRVVSIIEIPGPT